MEEDHQECSFCLKFADVGSQQGNLECRAHLADCPDTERFLPHEHGPPSGEIETACGNSGSSQSSIQELGRSSQHGTLLEGPNLEPILLQSSLKAAWHFARFHELPRETTVWHHDQTDHLASRGKQGRPTSCPSAFPLPCPTQKHFVGHSYNRLIFFFSSPEAVFLTPLDPMVTPTERSC